MLVVQGVWLNDPWYEWRSGKKVARQEETRLNPLLVFIFNYTPPTTFSGQI